MSTMSGDDGSGVFHRLSRDPSLADRVAQQLFEVVRSGRIKPGEKLPSERDLGEEFGVSRTVIREAVRSLRAKGVLDVRSGSGVTVAAPDPALVVESMRLYLGDGVSPGSPVTYDQVHEIRRALEVRIAESASRNASPKDLERMHAAVGAMDVAATGEEAAVADLNFHNVLAHATGNPLYPVLMDSLSAVLISIREATLNDTGSVARAQSYHREILAHVESGDSVGAAASMQRHLDDSAAIWQDAPVPD